jgi:hypothetical protein
MAGSPLKRKKKGGAPEGAEGLLQKFALKNLKSSSGLLAFV